MSELTLTEPEVLTGHTDVICSTSIERIVTGRNAALAQIEVLMWLNCAHRWRPAILLP